MKLRFVTPDQRAVPEDAPTDGAVYFDALLGSSKNPGTLQRPKRYMSDLSRSAIVPDGRYYFRNDRIYHMASLPAPEARNAPALDVDLDNVGGSDRNLISGYGPGHPALLTGAAALTGWGAVKEDFGNTDLAQHGEQIDLPDWATMWSQHFAGRDPLFPSVWTPSLAGRMTEISRREVFSVVEGALARFYPDPANTQGVGNSPPDNISRDMAKANEADSFTVEIVKGAGDYKSITLWWRHPAIATHYGDTAGPVGAMLWFNSDPSNQSHSAVITGYDYGRSEVVAQMRPTKRSTGPNDPSAWIRILGHPFDIRQPGQYAVLHNSDGSKTGWRWRGDWQRGQSLIAARPTALKAKGDGWGLRNVEIGFAGGWERESLSLVDDKAVVVTRALDINDDDIGMADVGLVGVMSSDSSHGAIGSGNTSATRLAGSNIYFRDCQTVSGLKGAVAGGEVSGFTLYDLGRTAWTHASGDDLVTIRDYLNVRSSSAHGNGISTYQGVRNYLIDGMSSLDSTRPYTSQMGAAALVRPRNLTVKNALALGVRSIDTSEIKLASYLMTYDSGFEGSLVDRLLMPESNFMFFGGSDTSGNSEVLRSYIANPTFGSAADMFAGRVGIDTPTEFREVVFGNKDETAVTNKGGTAVRVVQSNEGPWGGSLTEKQWDVMSREAGDHEKYESFLLGAQRFNWEVPAYDPLDPQPGAPVELQHAGVPYYAGQQANSVVTHVIGARPMSVLSLPEGLGDNHLFELDQGRLVAAEQMPRDGRTLSVHVREVPQAKSGGSWVSHPQGARVTVLEIEGVR